ncbi:GFA family protein [Aquabacter cavernae]|uniref:GFA family protein n=1 Tax=Aquabacter cavernae TaxID=2496029 RepID=UPI000F8D3AE4|nr:GFA family protein [Aquabacter cavernae]
MSLTGGCLCGAVRYGVDAPPVVSCHCHCSLCRRASGAAFVTWTTIPVAALRWTRGTPAAFRSSPWATRHFCADCGTQLTFRVDASVEAADGTLDVTTASLDQSEEMRPAAHIWLSSRASWYALPDDGLARFEGDLPPGWTGG